MDVFANAFVHPTEALLEEYCFRRIPEPALSVLEEHLLLCEPCRLELAELDEYIQVVKSALQPALASHAVLPLHRQPQLPYLQSLRCWFWGVPLAFPRMAGIGVAAISLFFVAFAGWHAFTPSGSPKAEQKTAQVELAAMRGDSSPDLRTRPISGMALDLVIDHQRIPAASGYFVQVVDAHGREIWKGPAKAGSPWISVHLAKGLRPGKYWARLYTSQAELLREYGLEINAPAGAR